MQFGVTVRDLRKLRGLSQIELAKLAEISVSHLCLLEKGKREPSLSTIETIGAALRVPVGILMFLSASASSVPELTESQFDNLSNGILGLIDDAKRQESLF